MMRRSRKPKAELYGIVSRDGTRIVSRGFGSLHARIHGFAVAMDHVFVERVFEIAGGAVLPVKTPRVGFVVAEQQRGIAVRVQVVFGQIRMPRYDKAFVGGAESGLWRTVPPGPGVAKPKL